MNQIEVMSDTLASQVAAGEVVERPASVVKELVENALDAGAKAVEIEIQRGGVRLIRVTDDGVGMSEGDARLSIERHATSKLKSVEDLAAVSQLGFRGEALPSIASVARLNLQTAQAGEMGGIELRIEGGKLKQVRAAGLSKGTRIEVSDLFFNVPARRKFLKAETTEAAHVEHQIRLHALAFPGVRFTYKKDGRLVYDLPATDDFRVRIGGFLGQELARELVAIEKFAAAGISVSGQVLPGQHARRGKRHQCVFLNGRPIEDPAISRALRDAYRGMVQDGMNPTVFLIIDMNPAEVDVNVHPAKREVRFHHPHRVRDAVFKAVDRCLHPVEPSPEQEPPRPLASDDLAGLAKSPFNRPVERQGELVESRHTKENLPPRKIETNEAGTDPSYQEEAVPSSEPVDKSGVPCPEWRVIGKLQGKYVLFEGEDGLVAMDPTAARSRIWYERLLSGHEKETVPSQGLLVPELIELDARDLDVALNHAPYFADAGIQLESFGGNTLQVRALPALLEVKNVRQFITGMIDELVETLGGRRGKTLAFERFAGELAERISRAEDAGAEDPKQLLQELFDCSLPYCAACGRPTLVQLSMNELGRRFGR